MNEKRSELSDKIERIKDKISEIQGYLDYLVENVPASFEEYKEDLKAKAVCEHYFEKIAEACVDLAFLIIKERKFEIPKDEDSSFNILLKHSIISSNLAKQLISAKGMRNIIAHEYGKIDDFKVYHSLSEEIEKDVNEFLRAVEGHFKL